MTDKKKLKQLEIDNIIDETINLSILVKLKELNIITDKQFYVLKKKIKGKQSFIINNKWGMKKPYSKCYIR